MLPEVWDKFPKMCILNNKYSSGTLNPNKYDGIPLPVYVSFT